MADPPPPPPPESLPPDPPITENEEEADERSGRNEDTLSNSLLSGSGSSMADLVLQVKPRSLASSKSASEVVGGGGTSRKPKAGNFSSRLKKIKETRTKKDSSGTDTSSLSLSHSISTPAVVSATPSTQLFPPVLPDIQESIHEEPVTSIPKAKETMQEVRKESVHVYEPVEARPSTPPPPSSSVSHDYDMIIPGHPRDNDVPSVPPLPMTPPPKTTPLTTPTTVSPLSSTTFSFSGEDVSTEHLFPEGLPKESPLHEQPPSSLEGPPPPLEGPPLSLEGPPLPLEGPPLPSEGPPPSLEGPPPSLDGPPLPLKGPPLLTEGPPPFLDGPPFPIEGPSLPIDDPPSTLEGPFPLSRESLSLPEESPPFPGPLTGPPNLPTIDESPPPTDSPPLLPPTNAPPLPASDPPLPPTDTPPLLPPTDAPPLPTTDAPPFPPIDAPPLRPPTDSPPLPPIDAPPPNSDVSSHPQEGYSTNSISTTHQAIKEIQSAPVDKSSPLLSPGYVQFSTQGSSEGGFTTAGSSSANVGSSVTSFVSYTPDHTVPGGGINRPQSVSSLLHHHEQPFQSNLKKWRFTDLTDNELDPRPSSLPSSGHMRRVHSNIEDTMLHSSSGGIDRSLDSITENQTPLTTPTPSPPSLIQRRLTTGDIDDHEVTITQVAKTRWSLMIKEETGQTDIPPSPDKATPKIEKEQEITIKHSVNSDAKNASMVSKKPKKTLSLNENSLLSMKQHRHGNSDLYDTEGSPEGEGNLHKLNQGIPKSLSSLFDSVVSDIPELASSDNDEEEGEAALKRGAGSKPPPIDKAKEFNTSKKSPTTKKAVKLPANAVKLPAANAVKLPATNGGKLPTSSPPTVTPTNTNQQTKLDHKSDSKTKKSVANFVHKKNVNKRSETLKPMKVFMQKIHPGLMYKMFMMSTSTTAHDVVEQGLEKANIIDDPRCFALYEVYDSTNEVLRLLQEQDCPLSSGGTTSSAPTHLELRRFRVHQSKSIKISTELLPSTKKRSVQLTISTLTTAGEVATLCLRKLQLYKDTDSNSDRNKYKMMIMDKKAAEEWLIDDERCLLDEMKEGCIVSIVDIEQYLSKGKEERSFIEQALPDDPHVVKAMLKESNVKIDNLQTDMLLKEHMIKQLREKLEITNRAANQEIESIGSLKMKYKELQESSVKEIKELQAALNRAEEEAKEKEKSVKKILSGIEVQYKTITDKNTTMVRSVAAAKNEMEKLIEEKRVAVSSLEASLSEKDEIITELNSEMEVMRTSLSGEGLNQILQSNEGQKRNEAEAEVVSRLEQKIKELEDENQDLKSMSTNESSLFNLLKGGMDLSKHTVIVLEAVAGSDGTLGVDTIYGDGSGWCVLKSIAKSSSVDGILESGDRLLEVNGCVGGEDIVNILREPLTGPLKIVASRGLVSLEVEERLAEQVEVNEQLLKDNERLKGELNSSLATLGSVENELKKYQNEVDSLKKNQLPESPDGHVNDIHRLRHQLTCSSEVADDSTNESLADTLKDSDNGEILEVLRTVETDCLNHKRSFDRLLEIVVTHNPELLEIIANDNKSDGNSNSAEEVDIDGWC